MVKKVGDGFLGHAAGQLDLVRQARSIKSRAQASGQSIILHRFIKQVMPKYRLYRFHAELIRQLQRVIDGDCKRLIISTHPRIGKSLLSSRILPAAYLLAHPERYVAICSYSAELAEGFSKEARDFYREGGGVLDPAQQAVNEWGTAAGGGCWAAGVGGSVVGRSANLVVGDDTVKGREDADSVRSMDRLWNFYQGSLYTRLEPGDSAVVIVATRWGENDLTGRLLEAERNAPPEGRENWTIVDWPAISEDPGSRPPMPEHCELIPDWREEAGIALCPQRYDIADLERIRLVVGPREWSAQYQQRPAPLDGNMFNIGWWRYYDSYDDLPQMDRVMVSLDCSFADESDSDFVVATLIGQAGPNFYVLEMLRRRTDVVGALSMVSALMNREKFRPDGVIIELAANGYAVYQIMRRKVPGLIGYKPGDRSKIGRVAALEPVVAAGNLHLPRNASWLDTFVNEFSLFPNAKNDDICDSVAQAVNYMGQRTTPQITQVHWGRASFLPESMSQNTPW